MSDVRLRRIVRWLRRVLLRRPVALQFDRSGRTPRSPPQKWTARRRLMVCTAVASGSFALVTYVWRVLDAAGRATQAAAVEALEQRLRESRAKLARLPQLRQSAPARLAPLRGPVRSASDDLRAVADLAAHTGVTLHALVPASAATASAARDRKRGTAHHVLRVDGQADFAGLYAFLGGLSTLPMLVVPEVLEIKSEKGALMLGATFDIFDRPTAGAVPANEIEPFAVEAAVAQASPPLADPFAGGTSGADAGASAGRLVGVVRDGRRALALFEPASGQQAVAAVPGQALGRDRLVAVDADGVTLANAGTTRRVVLAEGER